MNVESFYIDSSMPFESVNEGFFGYVISDVVYHYKSNLPEFERLFSSVNNNCGVFSCIFKDNGKVIIFTDPFSQYPVFYYNDNGSFCISNEFKKVSEFSNGGLNKEAILDCFTYYSPVNNETVIKGCYTTKPLTYIEIDYSLDDGPKLEIKNIKLDSNDFSYDELLDLSVERLLSRARSILKNHNPVVHLTGGLDSRLSLASFLSASDSSEDFSVFCFGKDSNQDKLIFNHLCRKYDLNHGEMLINGINVNSLLSLKFSSKAFNGLKYTNQNNYYSRWSPDHSEVTGYFSGGLLKGFGKYFNNSVYFPFKYALSISSISDFAFNSTSFRMLKEMQSYREKSIDNENLLYLSNRSKCHFGIHSVVNNKSFHSFDILYDPLFIHLYTACPYPKNIKDQGAIITDLIERVHSRELAFFPLAGRVMPKYKDEVNLISFENCFNNLNLPRLNNDHILDVKSTYDKEKYFKTDEYFTSIYDVRDSLSVNQEFEDLIDCLIVDKSKLTKVESSVLHSLYGYFDFLN